MEIIYLTCNIFSSTEYWEILLNVNEDDEITIKNRLWEVYIEHLLFRKKKYACRQTSSISAALLKVWKMLKMIII